MGSKGSLAMLMAFPTVRALALSWATVVGVFAAAMTLLTRVSTVKLAASATEAWPVRPPLSCAITFTRKS